MKPHMNRDVFHTKDVFFKRAAKICAAVRFRPGPCPKRFKSGDTHLEVHASNVWNISIIQHQSNFKGKVAFVKQNRTFSMTTLGYLINVQQILLFFGRNSYLHGLISSYMFIYF